jgi:opacity protein-like surface antigen
LEIIFKQSTMRLSILLCFVGSILHVNAQEASAGAGLSVIKPLGQNSFYLGLNAFGEYDVSDSWGYALNVSFTLPNTFVGEKVLLQPIDFSAPIASKYITAKNRVRISAFEGTRRFYLGDKYEDGFSGHIGTGIGLGLVKWNTRLADYDQSVYATDANFIQKNQAIYINWVLEAGVNYTKYWGSIYANFSASLPFQGFYGTKTSYAPKESAVTLFTHVTLGIRKNISFN